MIGARQRRLALLVAACFFMENLDATIVTTAAPRIAAALHVDSTATSMVITAYLLTLAILIPVSGWMTARWGARRVFLAAIVVFTVGSAACAASSSLDELVAMRVLQGVGGAMMVPVGRLVVLSRSPKSQLMQVTSYIVWPGLIAPVIAPLAGGLITTYASWRWMFLINVPLGVGAFAAAWRLVEAADPDAERPPPLDRAGVLLTCGGLAGLTYDGHLLSEARTPWVPAVVLGAASLLVLAVSVRHLLRTPAPLVNLRTLRVPTFGASIAGAAAFFIPVGATPFLLPLLFEEVWGWSAVKAGVVVLFVFAGNVGIKPATTYLYNRFGFRRMLLTTSVGLGATMLGFAAACAGAPTALIMFVALLSGVARSVGLTGYSTMMFSEVPSEQMRDANSLAATNQQLFVGLAVAVAAVALRAGHPVASALLGDRAAWLPYAFAFVALAVVAAVPLWGALRLDPEAGDVLRTRARVGAVERSG